MIWCNWCMASVRAATVRAALRCSSARQSAGGSKSAPRVTAPNDRGYCPACKELPQLH
jgi:hypothetical protein